MEKQKQLYEKAKAHNKEGDFRNNDFAVYAIQLFNLLYPGQNHQADHDVRFSAFKNVLSDWFKAARAYDANDLKKEISNHVNKDKWQEYHVVFGVPLKLRNKDGFPFRQSIKLTDVTVYRRSWAAVKNIDQGAFRKELLEIHQKERYDELTAMRIIQKQYLFFEAKIWAARESIAVNKVHDAFALFTTAATVAQERFSTVFYYGNSGIKSRKPILNPYLLYIKGNPTTGAYVAANNSLELPDADVRFVDDKRKMNTYKNYLRIMLASKPTSVEQRIRSVATEFDKALQLTDPHLRALSLWRCLELATRTANQDTRKQEEIIAIIASYRQDDPWKEQGKVIASFRNKYVHEGEGLTYDTRDHYLCWLQEYVSAALSLLFWMKIHGIGKTFNEIDDFFDMYSASEETLELAAKMLRAKKRLKS